MSFIRTCILSLSLFCVSTVLPETCFIQPVEARTETDRVAVLDLGISGQAQLSEAKILTDRLRSLIVKSRNYQVMEREAMDKILKEQGFQSSQECETQGCTLQIGRLLAVKQIITGQLNKIGNLYSLSLRFIDVESGAILKEDYVDCNCSLENLMLEQLPQLVKVILGNTGGAIVENNQAVQTGLPIRKQRPWLALAQGGMSNAGSLTLQYNFNEYLALYGGAAYSFIRTSPVLLAGGKLYFNPHDLAGFLEVAYLTNSVINGGLGLEYRMASGLSFSLTAGAAFDIRKILPYTSVSGGVGYAF